MNQSEWFIERSRENLVLYFQDELQHFEKTGILRVTPTEKKSLLKHSILNKRVDGRGAFYNLSPLGEELLRKAEEGKL